MVPDFLIHLPLFPESSAYTLIPPSPDDLKGFEELRDAYSFFKENEGLDDDHFEKVFNVKQSKGKRKEGKKEENGEKKEENGGKKEEKKEDRKLSDKLDKKEKVSCKELLEKDEKKRKKYEE
jgi:hypothetical protein